MREIEQEENALPDEGQGAEAGAEEDLEKNQKGASKEKMKSPDFNRWVFVPELSAIEGNKSDITLVRALPGGVIFRNIVAFEAPQGGVSVSSSMTFVPGIEAKVDKENRITFPAAEKKGKA